MERRVVGMGSTGTSSSVASSVPVVVRPVDVNVDDDETSAGDTGVPLLFLLSFFVLDSVREESSLVRVTAAVSSPCGGGTTTACFWEDAVKNAAIFVCFGPVVTTFTFGFVPKKESNDVCCCCFGFVMIAK